MKLKEEFIHYSKEIVYDMYMRIVYDYKFYDSITRGKMLEEIVKEYAQEHFLYAICTQKELEFLQEVQKHQLQKKDLQKYAWEIRELNNKGIFSNTTFTIFEEFQEIVKKELKFYEGRKIQKQNMDKLITFIISIVKINGEMLTKALGSILESMWSIPYNDFNSLLGNPLIHFYCDFSSKYIESFEREEETIYYREYWNLLDDLDDARQKFGIAGTNPFDIRDYYDIFYYGFPIRNEKVKLMYDTIRKRPISAFLFRTIDEARVLNYREVLSFIFEGKDLKIINEALDEMPCSAMNGFTPKDYKKEMYKSIDLHKQLVIIPQHNAHLCKDAADLYYKLYFGVLDYTNKKYHLCPEIVRIYKQEGLDVNKLMKVDDYLWEHKNIIDDFVIENPYNFTNEELEIIKGFKSAVTSDHFLLMGFEREYTEILSEDGKLYMVKGVRADIDKIISPTEIPKMIKTTLLMFQGKLIFNSFFSYVGIQAGNEIIEYALENAKKAIKYYHL